jgi:hypothetical protein
LIGEVLPAMDLQNRPSSSETIAEPGWNAISDDPLAPCCYQAWDSWRLSYGFQWAQTGLAEGAGDLLYPGSLVIDGTRYRADVRKKPTGNTFQGYSVGSNGLADQIKAKASQNTRARAHHGCDRDCEKRLAPRARATNCPVGASCAPLQSSELCLASWLKRGAMMCGIRHPVPTFDSKPITT